MANMNYCRFRNTLSDLRDCEEALQDGIENLDEDERKAAVRLVKMCARIAEAMPDIVEGK